MLQKSEYRKTLGSFATGVTIITTQCEGQHYGFTANSFTSVSLDPPLVLFCIKKDATFVEALKISKVFAINILSAAQENISNKFANSALMNEQRFEDVRTELSELKCPIIDGAIAYLQCEQVERTNAGDHFIILGKVVSFKKMNDDEPLLYYAGGYRALRQ